MKVYNMRTTYRLDFIEERFSKLHKLKANSKVEHYTRVRPDTSNVLLTNNTETGASNGSFDIVFGGPLFLFLGTVLPEVIEQTLYRLGLVSYYINTKSLEGVNGIETGLPSKNDYLTTEYNSLGYITFFANLVSGKYDNISEDARRFKLDCLAKTFEIESSFVISLRDVDGNTFSISEKMSPSKIEEGFSSIIRAPMNDVYTPTKDGFYDNEEVHLVLTNTNSNVSVDLIVTSASDFKALNLRVLKLDFISMSIDDKKKYNVFLYNMVQK